MSIIRPEVVNSQIFRLDYSILSILINNIFRRGNRMSKKDKLCRCGAAVTILTIMLVAAVILVGCKKHPDQPAHSENSSEELRSEIELRRTIGEDKLAMLAITSDKPSVAKRFIADQGINYSKHDCGCDSSL